MGKVNKIKEYTYNSLNGVIYKVQGGDKANDIVNRKIFSKENEKVEKVFVDKDEFARWKPTLDDLPSFLHSLKFFDSIKQTSDTDLNKAVYEDANYKVRLLLMKMAEIPGLFTPIEEKLPYQHKLSFALERLKFYSSDKLSSR